MTRASFRPAALAAALLALVAGSAAAAGRDLDPILRILVKKGVLTQQEAEGVQAEADAEKASQSVVVVTPPAPADATKKPSDVGTKYELGKGVTFSKGDMNLTITGRVQVRYDSGEEDADALGNVFGGTREGAEETFDVRRARVSFQGAFNKNLDYRLQADFSGSSTQVRYAEVDWHLKNKAFGINAGQFKVPFGREQLTSSGDLQFVDRSIVDAFFDPGFDRGVMLHGRTPEKGIFHYAFGVFNSEGDTSRNTDGDFRWAARVGVDPLGAYKPTQGGFERPEKARLAFALQAMHDDLRHATGSRESYGFDASFAKAFFTFDGAWVTTSHDVAGGHDFDADGWRLQMGFMLKGDLIELVARAAGIEADYPDGKAFLGEGPDYMTGRGFKTLGMTFDDGLGGVDGAIYDDLLAYTLGLNFYFHGHASKLQIDYTWVDEDGFGADAVALDNDFFRIQYQVKF